MLEQTTDSFPGFVIRVTPDDLLELAPELSREEALAILIKDWPMVQDLVAATVESLLPFPDI